MNMCLSIVIRASTVSVNKTNFNDHRTVGLAECKQFLNLFGFDVQHICDKLI